MYFLGAVRRRDGTWVKGLPTLNRDVAYGWAMRERMRRESPLDAVVFYADSEHAVFRLYEKFVTKQLDTERLALEEAEPVRDHDEPYRFTLPEDVSVQLDWARLLARVEAGEIGGADDGADRHRLTGEQVTN